VVDSLIPSLFEELLVPEEDVKKRSRREEEEERVVRKRARERRRRAEVGEKFSELVKVLAEAEDKVAPPVLENDDGHTRVDILERAIAFIKKARGDDRAAAATGLLGFTKDNKETQTDDTIECLVVGTMRLPPSALQDFQPHIQQQGHMSQRNIVQDKNTAYLAVSNFIDNNNNNNNNNNRSLNHHHPTKSYFAIEA